MKKTYVRPTAVAESFVANDYCSACGKTSDGTYHFTCDAPGGYLYYYRSGAGGVGQYGTYIGNYHPCGARHDTKNKGNFYEGYVDYNNNRREDAGEHVLVWRGDRGDNGHGTVTLSMGEIDVERS